jgi:multidrug resistance efflux pump
MEIQNNNQTNQNPKRKYWKFVVWFLAIIVLAAGGFFVWDKYFSP